MAGPSETKPPMAKESDVIVVDLGKKRRKQIKALRRGKGKLMDRVKRCLEELKASGTISGAAVPVVIVVEEESQVFDFMKMGR